MIQNRISKPLMLSYHEMIIKDFLETKITCLKNDKVYCQNNEELLYEIERDMLIYLMIFDMLFGIEYCMNDLEDFEEIEKKNIIADLEYYMGNSEK